MSRWHWPSSPVPIESWTGCKRMQCFSLVLGTLISLHTLGAVSHCLEHPPPPGAAFRTRVPESSGGGADSTRNPPGWTFRRPAAPRDQHRAQRGNGSGTALSPTQLVQPEPDSFSVQGPPHLLLGALREGDSETPRRASWGANL